MAMGGFDAVALVSGGKDSVMAAMMAESYGHRVVALANLLPADVGVEELDSHCFQTVGHRAVAAYGELTGLPLFRRRLRGSSKHTEMTYEIGSSTSAGDEVEDLRALLAAVVEKMPTVRAVTAGAILSDYQRLRVEAVCADLGLVSLAYLWRQPQPLMLETMCASDVDAILVKVAAMGLIPAKHLGRSLAEMRPTLYRIEREFGSHCCGEGGEFETLTLDCPFFRRARLIIQPDDAPPPEIVVTSPDPYAPSGHLAVERHVVALKTPPAAPPGARPRAPGPPGTALGAGANDATDDAGDDAEAGDVSRAGEVIDVESPAPPPRATRRDAAAAAAAAEATGTTTGAPLVRAFGGSAAPVVHVSASVPAANPIDAACAAAASAEAGLHAVEARLGALGLDWSAVDAVRLYVEDMSHFAAVNAAYVRVVPTHSPPARACVELRLPAGVPAAVEVIAATREGSGPASRRSLHVQSLSCWAPACIGPYGQAVSHLGLARLAGCIAMDPATLDMVGVRSSGKIADAGADALAADARTQARRAWRSAAAVCRAVGGSLPRDVAAAVVFSSARGGAAAARASDEAFAEILAGEPWQMRVDVPGGPLAAEAGVPPGRTYDDDDGDVGAGDEDGDGDEFSGAEPRRHPWRPLVTHVRVPRLPKDALVEVQPILLDRDGPGVPAPDRDDASGSDSDSGAIGDGDARGVAGANESGPGGSRCESLHRPGRFCCAHVAVPSGKVDEVSVGWAVSALSSALTRAGLTWAHAGTARGYVERGSDSEETAATVDRALAAVARVDGGEGGTWACALVPVLAASACGVEDAGLVLELWAATA